MKTENDSGSLESSPTTVGQPTVRDRFVQAIQTVCEGLALDPKLAPFAVGFEAVLGMIPEQGEESLRSFVSELGEDIKNLDEGARQTQLHLERMQNSGYRVLVVNVLRAVQFEIQEDKRSCYRAILLNPLREGIPINPQAKQEYFLNVLNGLSVYALLVLRVLSDPTKARQEYENLRNPKNAPMGPVTFWEVIFVLSNGTAEQPTFGSVLMDLNSKRLIRLETISQSPDSVLQADVQNASRALTGFGQEFIRFVTFP